MPANPFALSIGVFCKLLNTLYMWSRIFILIVSVGFGLGLMREAGGKVSWVGALLTYLSSLQPVLI